MGNRGIDSEEERDAIGALFDILLWEECKEIAAKRGYELSVNEQGYRLKEKDKIYSSIYKLADFLKG